MKKYMIFVMVLCFTIFSLGCGATPDESTGNDASQESESASKVDYSEVATTWDLGPGYYIAGIDIPAGTFDVTAASGIGYISSDYESANLRGSEFSEEEFGEYSTSFKNYSIKEGEQLEVSDLSVELQYSSVESFVEGRTYDENAGIEMHPGNYVIGKDLDPGRYCIKYLSGGGGYVASENGEFGANMDGDPSTGDYSDYFSNVVLEDGENIEVTTGLTVLFIPELE